MLTLRLCLWPVHVEFLCGNTPILARSVLVLHGHRFCRDMVVVLIAYVVILDFGLFSEAVN